MRRVIIACIVLVIFAGCSGQDARTLGAVFDGLSAVSELAQVREQKRIADALEKNQQTPDNEQTQAKE